MSSDFQGVECVRQMTLIQSGPTACIWVGSSPPSTELLFIQMRAGDSDERLQRKRAMISLFGEAQLAGREVDVEHADDSAEIDRVATTACTDSTPVQVDAIEVRPRAFRISLSPSRCSQANGP